MYHARVSQSSTDTACNMSFILVSFKVCIYKQAITFILTTFILHLTYFVKTNVKNVKDGDTYSHRDISVKKRWYVVPLFPIYSALKNAVFTEPDSDKILDFSMASISVCDFNQQPL